MVTTDRRSTATMVFGSDIPGGVGKTAKPETESTDPQDPVGKRVSAGVWENCPPDAKAWDRSYHFSLSDSSDV